MTFNDLTDYHTTSLYLYDLWHGMDSKMLSTMVLALLAVVVRSLVARWLDKNEQIAPHIVIQWKQRLQRATLLAIILFILIIWAPELRAFAVTLVVVASAIVVALKEVITCFTGSIIRATVEGARVGGRIVINNVHGDVAATDLMSTTILEVNDYGQRTGRTIVLPNSHFITHPTVTESADDRKYLLMMVGIPAKRKDDWLAIEQALLECGQMISEPYIKEAKKHFLRFDRRYGFKAPGPEPKVLIDWKDADTIMLNLRVAVPVTEQNAKRQEVYRFIMKRLGETTIVPPENAENAAIL